MKSFKAEVIADSSGKWVANAVRLATREEAEAYGRNLFDRWTLVRQVRVAESEDPPNYKADAAGNIEPIGDLP
jgi:hypothetical protein